MYWPPFWNKVYEVRKKPRGEKLLSNKQTSARHKKKKTAYYHMLFNQGTPLSRPFGPS